MLRLSLLRTNLNQYLVPSLLVLGCFAALGMIQMPQLNYLKTKSENSTPKTFRAEVESEKLRLNLLKKIPVLGFDNLFADWVFLGFAQYFGDDKAREVTGYQISPDYFDIIIDRDPRFLQSYIFLSTSLSIYAAMPEKSVALMDKGLKSLSPQFPPKSYYVWRYKGTDELLFLGNPQSAQKSFENASKWASLSTDQESQNIAAVSQQTAQFLAHNPQSKYAQINSWAMILSNPVDKHTRDIAIKRIESLGGKIIISSDGKLQIEMPNKD